jgi:Tol biopolymer transport system component
MGNHNIMIMDLSDLSIRPLTIHPNTETHPRISPDGKQVAFSRSVTKWQSWREQKPWNIWIKDIDTGRETLVANHGAAPSWSADGKTLYFNRNGREIWSYNFSRKLETKLFERNVAGIPDSELRWPSVDENGVLAVSYRDFGRPTNLIADESGNIITVARGCMLTWSPDNTFAMFISSSEGGRQKNQINRFDRETGQITKWLDLPGELSHEYFPRLNESQEFLVFASSDGAHEPDLADYEIFIWKTDTPASSAQRLTFDGANDSWPDVFIVN